MSTTRIMAIGLVLTCMGLAWAWAFHSMRRFVKWMIERDGQYNSDGTPKS